MRQINNFFSIKITTLFKLAMRLSRFMLMAAMTDSDRGSYKSQLDIDEKLNRDKRIPRAALTRYKYSSFKYLYLSGNDQALINATGHDHTSFSKLLHKFKPIYDLYMWDENELCIRRKLHGRTVYQKEKTRHDRICLSRSYFDVVLYYRIMR